MEKLAVLAALLASAALAAPPVFAADPALVAGVEKYLRGDEKPVLAALLTHPDLSDEFQAEAPLALKNPKILGPFLGVWRAKMEAFAENDAKRPGPDLAAHYATYAELMTPEQKAYMIRSLQDMKQSDRDALIGYLDSINGALTEYGELTWYTKKVVAGILYQYQQSLKAYAATPIAQAAKRDAASSAQALAAATPAAVPASAPAGAAAVKPASNAPTSPLTPVPDAGSVAATAPSGGALDQARAAANAGAGAGQVFDGGTSADRPAAGDAVVVPPGSGGARPTLSPNAPGAASGLAGAFPAVPPPPGESGFMDAIRKFRAGPARTPFIQRLPAIVGGVLGGIMGGVLGFVLGGALGPIGALGGAIVGIGLGAAAGQLIALKLFQ